MFETGTKKIDKLVEKKKSDKIASFLDDKDPVIVCYALKSLAKIADETAINSIAHCIDDDDIQIRRAAIEATGEICTEYSKTFLQQRLTKEKDESIKTLILDMIRQINNNK